SQALETFAQFESRQQAETPDMLYCDLLAAVYRRLAQHWAVAASEEECRRFGNSIPDWPAFPDTVEALRHLKRHHKLVILSNVDRKSFASSNQRLGVQFDAIYTAEDIGSYKPDPRNFAYMLERLAALGYGRADILHVAQSLFHDHAPANAAGLASVWIDRRHEAEGWGATKPPKKTPRYARRFASLAELVAAHREELAGRG
ncbi:MAG: HAD-IA family hydrolase, partial [Rhodospirillales bacterium]|nr:HAD-IA family hydrolase [Rhodospirillales bacterium]